MLRSGNPQAISLDEQGASHLDENDVSDGELAAYSENNTSPRSAGEERVREEPSTPARAAEVDTLVGIPTIAVTPATADQSPVCQKTGFSHLVHDDARLPPLRTSHTSPTSSPSSSSSSSSVTSPATSADSSATPSIWSRFGFGAKTTTQIMALTGDSRPGRDPESRKVRAGTWWPGTPDSSPSSARSSRLLSTSTTNTPDAGDVPSISRLKKSHTVGSSPGETPSRPGSSAFSFITSSMSALSRLKQPNAMYAPDDELSNMNIEAALQPAGPTAPDGQDASPAAMREMQAQATALLTKFQTAYRAQSAALRDMQAELSAERDERAGTDARNRHLRSRLDNMVAKASEHEQAMAAILEELTAEKKARFGYEQAAREKGVALVARGDHEDSVVTEDLGAEEDQRRRRWAEERTDGGSETSDEEGYEEASSIFSGSRSPTIAPSISESPDASPTAGRGSPPTIGGQMYSHQVTKLRTQQQQQQQQQQPQRWSALQKMFKGGAADGTGTGGPANGCLRCRGADASVAWNTVSLLRDENRGLKQQVAVLETAVEGALDVVNGVGI